MVKAQLVINAPNFGFKCSKFKISLVTPILSCQVLLKTSGFNCCGTKRLAKSVRYIEVPPKSQSLKKLLGFSGFRAIFLPLMRRYATPLQWLWSHYRVKIAYMASLITLESTLKCDPKNTISRSRRRGCNVSS